MGVACEMLSGKSWQECVCVLTNVYARKKRKIVLYSKNNNLIFSAPSANLYKITTKISKSQKSHVFVYIVHLIEKEHDTTHSFFGKKLN